jgi:hypothetical protein
MTGYFLGVDRQDLAIIDKVSIKTVMRWAPVGGGAQR